MLPKEKHIAGKKHTKKIEGGKHMVRDKAEKAGKAEGLLLKKLFYHCSIMKTAICERNIRAYI